MMGHQDIGVNRTHMFSRGMTEPIEINSVIVISEENRLSDIPALNNVQGRTGE